MIRAVALRGPEAMPESESRLVAGKVEKGSSRGEVDTPMPITVAVANQGSRAQERGQEWGRARGRAWAVTQVLAAAAVRALESAP